MKEVLIHILRRRHEYSKLPLFERMRDERIPARNRLSFFPQLGFFIMSFGDLNRYILRDETTKDALQEVLNAHTREDDHHWPWFLDDLEVLGWNKPTTMTDAMRHLWGKESHRARLLMYDLCGTLARAKGVERLAVVEAIEETGYVMFTLTAQLADEIRAESGKELMYFGHFHTELETGHMQNSDHQQLMEIQLDEAQREHCIALADEVFDTFTAWTQEGLRNMKLDLEAQPA